MYVTYSPSSQNVTFIMRLCQKAMHLQVRLHNRKGKGKSSPPASDIFVCYPVEIFQKNVSIIMSFRYNVYTIQE